MGEVFYKEFIDLKSEGIRLRGFEFLNLLGLNKKDFLDKFNLKTLPLRYEVADMGDCMEVLCYFKGSFTKTIELDKDEYNNLYKVIA